VENARYGHPNRDSCKWSTALPVFRSSCITRADSDYSRFRTTDPDGGTVPESAVVGRAFQILDGAVARWQRDEALLRTAARRPDLIRRLAAVAGGLDKRDRKVLAEAGFPVDAENMAH
jgi:hypothetical protein